MTAFPSKCLLLPLSLAWLLSACGGEPRPAAPAPVVQAPPDAAPEPVKIGVALGGGAAKGFAHIGVIKMIEANG
ncbi:patatin-like phospholipase family protein, partial [Xanthomonas oryzae pv. oryzicola]|nr:patatin-like phospholipase family protein [Xanthomonas oryzae pv. oryzicola]